MLRQLKRASLTLAALALAASIIAGLAWWSIHTAWFANLVRSRLVSILETATGGRVELHSFTFDPGALHAKITGLTVHGTEPAGSLPLLSIDSIDVGLKILSVWRQVVDVESVSIVHPEIHVLVNADGTTNVPAPRRRQTESPVEQLIDLKIKQLTLTHGLAQVEKRKLPFQLISQGIGLLLNYDHSDPSYVVSFKIENLDFTVPGLMLKPMHISTRVRLFRDRADINNLTLVTNKSSSTIQLTGSVEHFSEPRAQGNLEASLSIDELAQMGGINGMLRNGRATFNGSAEFDGTSGRFTLTGKAKAQGVDFVSPQFTLRNIAAEANLVANNDGILLHQAQGAARGARFSGEGSIRNYSFLRVEGQISQVALREVGPYLTKLPFPWSGIANGTAHASAHLTDKDPDFIIGAKVEVAQGHTGVPVSGNVDVTFHAHGTNVEFGASTLRLPHSAVNFQGALNTDLLLKADTSDLTDLQPILPIFSSQISASDLPMLLDGGSANFDGVLHDLMDNPSIAGSISVSKFKFLNYVCDSLSGQFSHSPSALSIANFQLQRAGGRLSGKASIQLSSWFITDDSPLHLETRFTNLDLANTAALFGTASLPVIQGVASGNIDLQGTPNNPRGSGGFRISNFDAYGQQLNQILFDAVLDGNRVQVAKGRVQSGPALLNFSASYEHAPAAWSSGNLDFRADTNGFPLSGLSTVQKYLPAINGHAEAHLQATGKVSGAGFEPLKINGSADFSQVTLSNRELGNASVKAATEGDAIHFSYAGDLRNTRFQGQAEARLTSGTPIRGGLQMDRIGLATLKSLALGTGLVLPIDGYLNGSLAFDGSLEEPAKMHARATIDNLQMNSTPRPATVASTSVPDIVLKNNAPIVLDLANGIVSVTSFEIDGRDTGVKVTGSIPLFGDRPINLKAVGKADLTLFSLFDSNVRSSGSSELDADISGTMAAPNITGKLDLKNGSFFTSDLPNGLSDVNGTVLFGRNRATIQKMSAHSGGGDLTLGGSLSFGGGSPLVYHLEAAARSVRVRYGNSISVTANSDLRLSGTSASSILSGTLTVTRVVFTPNADAGNLLAAASSFTSSPADESDFISGLHLDIGVESAPNLQVSTNLSRDVEAEIQLRLRGTPDHPVVLGNITANQGDLKIFGTRFSLNRGQVDFVNTVRVEPVLDLDLETRARGVTVDITVSGTPSKLNFNYRSDPPLQPRDIIALLTVGHAPDLGTVNNAQNGSDVGALTTGVNSVLGQAISPVSNRLSKLFGITNIRIDPFVQAVTNTPQARLSVEQQISRDVTITYVTNLSQTSEQIFRFEWALSRQFSIIALRDDNGEFGVDFQYKKQFK